MIPADDWARYRQVTAGVRILTARDVRRLWREVDTSQMAAHYDRLLAGIRDVIRAYGEVSATAAADFYDAVRAASRLPPKAAELVGFAADEAVEVMFRASLGPLWEDSPRPEAALTRLEAGAIRMALQPGRETMHQAVRRDGLRYAIVPQGGNTCAFCLMLASRGATYANVQPQWHDNCQCDCIPVVDSSDLPQINQDLHDEWVEVTKGQADQMSAWRAHIAATRAAQSSE